MRPQCHFETDKSKRSKNHPGRDRATVAKHRAQYEARKQRELEVKLSAARQLQTIINRLEREVANLGDSIISELALSGVREPSHSAFPISARMLLVRRENLKRTIAVLMDRLSSVSQPMSGPSSRPIDCYPHHFAARLDSN
jgi:hypothetical protein